MFSWISRWPWTVKGRHIQKQRANIYLLTVLSSTYLSRIFVFLLFIFFSIVHGALRDVVQLCMGRYKQGYNGEKVVTPGSFIFHSTYARTGLCPRPYPVKISRPLLLCLEHGISLLAQLLLFCLSSFLPRKETPLLSRLGEHCSSVPEIAAIGCVSHIPFVFCFLILYYRHWILQEQYFTLSWLCVTFSAWYYSYPF